MARVLYIRKFLNRAGFHAGAYVLVCVHAYEDSVSVRFRLSDCFDVISLDFDMDTPAERRNSLYKAAVLRDAVTRLEQALQAESRRLAS